MLAGILLSLLITGCSKPEKNEVIMTSVEEEPVGYYMYVSSEGLNVRQQPDADSSIMGVLLQNDMVVTDKVSNGGWYKIRAIDESVEGYVNSHYLSDNPLSEEEIAAQKAAAKKAAEEELAKKEAEAASQTQPETRSISLDDLDAIPDTPRGKLTKLPKN